MRKKVWGRERKRERKIVGEIVREREGESERERGEIVRERESEREKNVREGESKR